MDSIVATICNLYKVMWNLFVLYIVNACLWGFNDQTHDYSTVYTSLVTQGVVTIGSRVTCLLPLKFTHPTN